MRCTPMRTDSCTPACFTDLLCDVVSFVYVFVSTCVILFERLHFRITSQAVSMQFIIKICMKDVS